MNEEIVSGGSKIGSDVVTSDTVVGITVVIGHKTVDVSEKVVVLGSIFSVGITRVEVVIKVAVPSGPGHATELIVEVARRLKNNKTR